MNDVQNIYDAHSEALAMVQAEAVVGSSNATTGAGTVNFTNQQPFPAWIGPMEQLQVLRPDGGGWTPSLRGMVLVNKTNLPATTAFRTGNRLTVTAPGCVPRQCQLVSWMDKFSFWEIIVEDISQNS